MLLSASALLLATASPQAATDITPFSLATRPQIVDLGDTIYDWDRQQVRRAPGVKLADSTANCNTDGWETQRNGQTDQVHDCGFD